MPAPEGQRNHHTRRRRTWHMPLCPSGARVIENFSPRVARCFASLHPWLQPAAPPGPKAALAFARSRSIRRCEGTAVVAPEGRRHVATSGAQRNSWKGEAQRNPWKRWRVSDAAPEGQRTSPSGATGILPVRSAGKACMPFGLQEAWRGRLVAVVDGGRVPAAHWRHASGARRCTTAPPQPCRTPIPRQFRQVDATQRHATCRY
jgi:hypothetical protein